MEKLFNNQKVIRFITSPKDFYHPYTMWDNEALCDVLENLTAMGLKMYLYLGLQKDKGEELVLSRADAMKALSISEGTYHRVIKELKDKGYLIQDPTEPKYDGVDNFYIFLEDKNFRPNFRF